METEHVAVDGKRAMERLKLVLEPTGIFVGKDQSPTGELY